MKRKTFLLKFQLLEHSLRGLDFPDSRVDGETLKQSGKLFIGQFPQVFLLPGPFKRSFLKPFVQKQESVAFPDQCFNTVISSSAEQEDGLRREWVQTKFFFYRLCQTVDTVTQIRIAAGNVNVFKSEITEHRQAPPGPCGHVPPEYPVQC